MFKYTEQKLAQDIERLAKEINPELVCQYDQKNHEVVLKSQDGMVCTMSLVTPLVNAMRLKKKPRLAHIKAAILENLTAGEALPDEFLASLCFRIRTELGLKLRKLQQEDYSQKHNNATFSESAHIKSGDMLVELVADREKTLICVTTEQLSEAKVTIDEAVKIAAANLIRATDGHQWRAVGPNIWLSTYQDEYDFARVVAAKNHVKFPFDFDPVIFAPSHSVCLATDPMNVNSLEKTIEIGDEMSQHYKSLSQLLWSMASNGEWQEWQPRGTPVLEAIADLQNKKEKMFQYEQQAKHLENLPANDIFFPMFQLLNKKDSPEHISMCVYSFDIPTCLPIVDYVSLVDPSIPSDDEKVLGLIPWSEFRNCLGTKLQNTTNDLVLPYVKIIEKLTSVEKDTLRDQAIHDIDRIAGTGIQASDGPLGPCCRSTPPRG